MFIKVFSSWTEASDFANLVKGILTIRYSWNDMFRTIEEEYVVRYQVR